MSTSTAQLAGNKMMADGLTKTLNKALFQRFRDMIGLEDQVERLTLIRREDELKD
jgi:hypothetical protein